MADMTRASKHAIVRMTGKRVIWGIVRLGVKSQEGGPDFDPRPSAGGFVWSLKIWGVSLAAKLPDSKPGLARSNRAAPAKIGCEAHSDEQASHKGEVVSSILTTATKFYEIIGT